MEFKPYNYQQFALNQILNLKGAGLFKDMGLGKTVVCLSAVKYLAYTELEIDKTLIIAPKKVAESTWTDEIQKWDHTRCLTVSKIMGKEKDRKKALLKKADVYITNRENVKWLVSYLAGACPFDMLIVDESSSFKNPDSGRFKAIRQIIPFFKKTVILSGTPQPNGEMDLWSQIYILDRGERLGKTITEFRNRYFKPQPFKPYPVYEIIGDKKDPDGRTPDYYRQKIYDKISDICISMKTEDYLELPERVDIDRMIDLPEDTMKKYIEFEKSLILQLSDEKDITALNAGALLNKLMQFSNGAVYDENRIVHEIHDEKIDSLIEMLEEANGKPMLVFYQFQHDRDRIMQKCKAFRPKLLDTKKDLDDWNAGKIQTLLAHPKSAGHGLNMQFGGNLCTWFSLNFNLEEYLQGVKRIHRNGVVGRVINTRMLCRGTVDEDVLIRLSSKDSQQNAMLEAVKARIAKYR